MTMDVDTKLDECKMRCDMACEILRGTNDGDDLSPGDLYLVQELVNDHLTPKGIEYARNIRDQVKAGTYVKPWMCGVEGLTQDHEGYVYWKGVQIEHYSHSDYTKKKQDAIELARRCLLLESLYIQPTCGRVVWRWSDYEPDEPCSGRADNLPPEIRR